MKTLAASGIALLLAGCSTFNIPVKELNPENTTTCTYISNLGEVLATYAVYSPTVKYGGNIGYQGTTVGGTVDKNNVFIELQEKLSQQAATINSVAKSIVVMQNKSCDKENLNRSWDAMELLIKSVQKTYAPVLLKQVD